MNDTMPIFLSLKVKYTRLKKWKLLNKKWHALHQKKAQVYRSREKEEFSKTISFCDYIFTIKSRKYFLTRFDKITVHVYPHTNKEFIAKLKVYVYRASNRVYINILYTLLSLSYDEKMKWQNGKSETSISSSRNNSVKLLSYMYYTTISLFRYIISLADV